MYCYRLYDAQGNEQGEAEYAFWVKEGETIKTGDGCQVRVTGVIPIWGESEKYVGLLTVEPV